MRAAFLGVDVVCESKNRFVVTVVILQRNFHDDVAVSFFEVYGFGEKHGFVLVQIFDEVAYAALEAEFVLFGRFGA